MKFRKRLAALGLALVLVFALGACASQKADEKAPSDGAAEEKVLNIFTWATYFPDDILAGFTEQTGIKINYSTFESNEEMLMKLEAGGEYDIVLASDYIIDIARNQGLLMELDKAQIPNYENIDPTYQNTFFDPDNQYVVPYSAGVPMLIYNPELTGDMEIKSYEDLWNPALADSIVVMDDARNVIGITLKTMGKSFNETDPEVLEEAKEKLMQLKPNIRALDYSTPYNLIIGGEASVGYMFTSQVITALNANPDLKYAYPEEGVGFGIDACFIPAKAPHAQNAHAFLNFILDGERSARITEQIFYGSCNAAAAEYITNPLLVIPADAIKNGESIMDVGEEATAIYNDIWTEFKQG